VKNQAWHSAFLLMWMGNIAVSVHAYNAGIYPLAVLAFVAALWSLMTAQGLVR
jgi:hypothetical protein